MNPFLEKAQRLEWIVEHHSLQAHGLLPIFVRASDYQLPTAADYAGAHHHVTCAARPRPSWTSRPCTYGGHWRTRPLTSAFPPPLKRAAPRAVLAGRKRAAGPRRPDRMVVRVLGREVARVL